MAGLWTDEAAETDDAPGASSSRLRSVVAASGAQRSRTSAENGAMARPRHPTARSPHPSAVHLRVPVLDAQTASPRIALVEDDVGTRHLLGERFRGVLDLVPIPTLRDAEARVREHWDAWIVDRRLPDGEGFEFALRLRERDPQISIVLYSGAEHTAVFERATAAGIIYALKPDGIAVLAQLASMWSAQRTPPSDSVGARVLSLVAERGLSDREEEIVWNALEGFSREQASMRMGISGSTHKNHVSNVLAKTGFESMRELLAWVNAFNHSKKDART